MLKKYEEFIKEYYKYSEIESDFLDILDDIMRKELIEKRGYRVDINYFSDLAMKDYPEFDITGQNTFISLYFNGIYNENKPSLKEIENIVNDYFIENRIFLKEYASTNSSLFIVACDIKTIMQSDLGKSLMSVNKFNL